MRAQLEAELLRQRSIRTTLWLFLSMVGLVILVVLLHALSPSPGLEQRTGQLMRFGQGERLGTVFAALLGALSITAEFRYGTIRPLLLVNPRRAEVLAAKVVVSVLIGAVFGLAANAAAVAVGSGALIERGVSIKLDGADYALMVAGGAGGAMLWAAIGVGIGAAMRNQVPALVGILTWLLFVEGVFEEALGLSQYGGLLPGALAQAATGLGSQQLLGPLPALALLAVYAAAASVAGWLAFSRRDIT